MLVWGLPKEAIVSAVQDVSLLYNGNVMFKRQPETKGRAVRFTLTVKNSRDIGARVSHTGRRVCAACWHVHRDILDNLFGYCPTCRVKTAIADYRGVDDFLLSFPATGNVNVGSRADPLYFKDACNCEDFAWTTGSKDIYVKHDSLESAEKWICDRQKIDPQGVFNGEYFIDGPVKVCYN